MPWCSYVNLINLINKQSCTKDEIISSTKTLPTHSTADSESLSNYVTMLCFLGHDIFWKLIALWIIGLLHVVYNSYFTSLILFASFNHCYRVTNADGRAPNLLTQEQFIPGKYMIRFETEAYFKEIGVSSFFYPYVEVRKCNLESTVAKGGCHGLNWATDYL